MVPSQLSPVYVGAAVAVILIVVLFAIVVSVTRSRRNLARRLAALSARLSDEELRLEGKGAEGLIDGIERLVDANVTAAGEASLALGRMEMALGQLHQGVIVADQDGEIVYSNARSEELLRGETSGSSARSVIEELLISAAEGGSHQATLEVAGDWPRTVDVVAAPLESRSQAIGGVAFIEDVSSRQRLDEARRDFVADIGQELRVPVGAIGLLAETVAADAQQPVVERLASRIQSEATRLGRVIEDMMALTRLQAEGAAAREPVLVHMVVAQAVERVRLLAQERRMTINFGEPARRLSVLGDRRQLVTAVFHLVDNAVKYSPEGTTVEVRARPDDGWVELMVRDHGVGIPQRDLGRVFDRFFRVDRGRPTSIGGSGLGLAVVRHVAAGHGGEVRVESREGDGSCFTMRLPAAISTARVERQQAAAGAGSRPRSLPPARTVVGEPPAALMPPVLAAGSVPPWDEPDEGQGERRRRRGRSGEEPDARDGEEAVAAAEVDGWDAVAAAAAGGVGWRDR